MNIIQKSLLVGGIVAFTPQTSEAKKIDNSDNLINISKTNIFTNKESKYTLFKDFNHVINRNLLSLEENILEISLGVGDNISDFVTNGTGYTTLKVITTEDRKLVRNDYDAIDNLQIPNIDLSEAYADEISYSAFNGATYLESFKYPKEVKIIANHAFRGCKNLSGNLVIPDTVTEIGSNAFSECNSFTGDLIIPDSVKKIGYCAFYETKGFSGGTLRLSNTLEFIDDWAFGYASNLTGDLIIPDSVTSIGEYAFAYCRGFTGDIVVGNGVRNIKSKAFERCENISGTLTIGNSVETIGDFAFNDCGKLTGDIALPNSLKSIGSKAFWFCPSLDGTLTIPNEIEYIGDSAFSGCSKLKGGLILPDTLTYLGEWAFQGCSSLKGELRIPNSITEIKNSTFSGCGFTGELVIPENITSIGSSAFSSCSGFTGDLTIPDSVVSMGNSIFLNCFNLNGDLYISKNITELEYGIFSGCNKIQSISLPEGLTSIGERVFANCQSVTDELIIPDSVVSIGNEAFSACRGITSVKFPENLVSIGDEAFYNCGNLTGEITLPDSLESFGRDVFINSTRLDKINININPSHIDSNYREEIGKNIDESKLFIDISYDIDITGTWLENISASNMGRPQLIGIIDKINNRGVNVALYIPTPCEESNIEVLKDGAEYLLPSKNSDNEYEFSEKGNYNINLVTNSGKESNIEFEITDAVSKPSIEYIDGTLRIIDNGHLVANDKTIVENFEDSDNLKFDFSNKSWVIENGIMKSQAVSHNYSTENIFKVKARKGDKLLIDTRVSSETNYDFGRIFINKVKVFESSGNNTSFETKEFTLKEGVNTIRFEYSKDNSSSSNDDKMYVDSITHNGIGELASNQVLEYKIDNGEWMVYSSPVKLSSLDLSKVNIQARMSVDGNISEIENATVHLDNYSAISEEIDKIESEYDQSTFEKLRRIVNSLEENDKKEELQTRLNNINYNISLNKKNTTANLDLYIKSENMLKLSIDTNSITFEDFSGVSDIVKQNAINLEVSSSLPYKIDAYLATEIQNAQKNKNMNKEILKIKANEKNENEYKSFADVNTTPITLLDDQVAGNDIVHGVDLKLEGGKAFDKDIYKTTIKFEVGQK